MPKIVVTGDITFDWNLFRSRSSQQAGALWEPDFTTNNCLTRGGAVLLRDIIAGLVGEESVLKPELTAEDEVPGRAPFWHSYASCERFVRKIGDKNAPPVWRIKEFLGLQATSVSKKPPRHLLLKDDGKANFIVVDNANQGFSKYREIWPKSLEGPEPNSWLVLKWSRPDFETPDPIWRHVLDKFKHRFIVVVTVNDLRLKEMQISRELSWERTALDLFREAASKIPDIDLCAHFIVSIYTEGALVISNGKGTRRATLYYDPQFIESTWKRQFPGMMAGYTQCLVAAITGHMIHSQDFQDIGPGVLTGISAARWLHENGFDYKEAAKGSPDLSGDFSFPLTGLVNEIKVGLKPATKTSLRQLELNLDVARDPAQSNTWTVLEKSYPNSDPTLAVDLANKIIAEGNASEQLNLPVGRFGKLLAINRTEIESLRAISSLIEEYAKSPAQKAPLSIAVFGPPGTGKSFTIREVAASLGSDGMISERELVFNLSQFTAPESIYNCLHQVRDVALTEKIPLVFWDEFDTRLGEVDLGWLRYFLAPMQDGVFQHGSLTHNVGRAVFVFAGGTQKTMKDFETAAKKKSEVKGRDFLSRLRGFVDIFGLDHPAGKLDASVIIRRSLLLRSSLERSVPGLVQKIGKKKTINVDSGVINAFLRVPSYYYGARSIEAITRMSRLSGKLSFDRSSLPAEDQLNLHVDAAAFMSLVSNRS